MTSKFRRLLLATTAACTVALVGATSCSVPQRLTPQQDEKAIPQASLNSEAGPPLPNNSIWESAGSIEPHPRTKVPVTGTYRPDDKTPRERIPDIYKRGRIIVGVDRSNNLMSYRDTASGEVRGFEVDIAREIARDIFDDPNKVDFRFVESSERTSALNERSVDIVIRTMSISAERQREVAFSTPYMTTKTKLLVLSSSGIRSIDDTAGKTLCAVQGSTIVDTVRREASTSNILQTRSWGDCLMALQLNQIDGVVADDALLSGMLAQDSYTSIVGAPLTSEDYGVAVRKPDSFYDSKPLLRQVNSTLERIRQDGTWDKLFATWLGDYLERPTLPAPNYLPEEESSNDADATKEAQR